MPVAQRGQWTSIFDFVQGDTTTHGRIVLRNIDDMGPTRIWIIIASVAGLLALGACIALMAVILSNRRLQQQLLGGARQQSPCLGEKSFNKKWRKTREVLEFDAESQRDAMIQKSLASRSGCSISSKSQLIGDTMSVDGRPDSMYAQDYRLRDEENVERSFTRSRSGTGLSDKSWEGGMPSRSKSPLPDLPARTWSRSSSPSPSRHADLPPLLEQHPLFRNMSDDPNPET